MPVPRSRQWRTVATRRTILAVVHNVTSATRLFDVLPIVARDPRVQIVFTRTGSSAFDAGTTEFLSRNGILELPWDQAVATEADLAIAASYGGDLHRIAAPLMVFPHGMGYNKYLKSKIENRSSGSRGRGSCTKVASFLRSSFSPTPNNSSGYVPPARRRWTRPWWPATPVSTGCWPAGRCARPTGKPSASPPASG
ncbi:hypothetical protein GCM10027521_36170 [Amycolatopsis cihanbeyliensis]